MVFTSISVNIKTATVFWLFLIVLFYFLCSVVWACVSFLNAMYLVFRLQRNCIFCTTRCAIGILTACSAVQNQRLTSVLTVAFLGSTWDPPWIGNNRRTFIFFPVLFSFPIALCAENASYDGEYGKDIFVVLLLLFIFCTTAMMVEAVIVHCVIYMLFSLFVHNLILKYHPLQLRSSFCMRVTSACSCSWLYLRQMVVTAVIMKQSKYLCIGRHCSVILVANSQKLLKFMAWIFSKIVIL